MQGGLSEQRGREGTQGRTDVRLSGEGEEVGCVCVCPIGIFIWDSDRRTGQVGLELESRYVLF